MPKFADIETFPVANYQIDVGWPYMQTQLDGYIKDGLDMNPDFQRAHVWTSAQQVSYIEYALRGGETGENILFNCPGFRMGSRLMDGSFVLVDGKQRLEAARRFMDNEIAAFGSYRNQYSDKIHFIRPSFKFRICELESRRAVLSWYLAFNAGGTVHTEEELQKVRVMFEAECELCNGTKVINHQHPTKPTGVIIAQNACPNCLIRPEND